jgi:PAS domain S-box-containing protein
VLYKGETIHISVPDIIAEILPRPIAKLASKIMRYTGKYSVLTALTRFGEPIGVFSMDAPKLADHFIPSAKSLARHISRALETAFEYERRMAAEAALIESEEKYHTFVRDSAYGYFELDLEGQITYLNTRSAEITGYSENEIKEIHFSKIIVPEELQKAYQGLQLAGSAGYQGPREYQILTKQGHIKSVEVNTLPLKKDNAMIGFMGTILDITQRKLAEKALKKSHDELETEVQDRTSALKDANIRLKNELTERNRAEKALFKAKAELERQYKELKKVDKIKDGLIRDVAHEKHAMQLDLLKEAVPQQPVTRTIFKVMDASIRRQEHVIRNILDLSRLEAGGRKYKRKSIRVDEIINRVLLDYATLFESYAVQVQTDISKVTIKSDGEMLGHVFSNIINNGVKYRLKGKEGLIQIRGRKNKKVLQIVFADKGIGLVKSEIKKAFDRFYQSVDNPLL